MMSAALTKEQKAYLAGLARAAHRRAGADAEGMNEADWRRSEVVRACGKFGLRCCSQDDYGAVKAHFLAALGREGAAMAALVHGDPEANRKRQARWRIGQELRRIGRDWAYAAGICRQMTKGAETLETASARVLWAVMVALTRVGDGDPGDMSPGGKAQTCLRTPNRQGFRQ